MSHSGGQLTLSAASTSSSGLIRLATRSIFHSHPDFVACYGASWTKYAHEPPAGQLRFADSNVTDFVTELFEASAELVKGNFFGTGGDEINEACVVGISLLNMISPGQPPEWVARLSCPGSLMRAQTREVPHQALTF